MDPLPPRAPPAPNTGFVYRERVGPEAARRSPLDHLAACYPHSSRAEWAERLLAGEVLLDGRPASGRERLRAGQRLDWHRPPWVEPWAPLDYLVVHEDRELLIVHKPSGLPTLPGGGFLTHTLLAQVRRRDPAYSPMHRLDRGTSGLIAFVRGRGPSAVLHAAFRSHTVEKHYLGLAVGALAAPRVLTAPIGPVAHPRLGTVHAATPDGRPSETLVLASEPRGEASRAELRIVTGRPHQIRIHLAWAGHPLVGDPLYGALGLPLPQGPGLPGDLGYALHSWRLAFDHPATGVRVAFESPPPEALR